MRVNGLHVDARRRPSGATTYYVRGRLVSELRGLLHDLLPGTIRASDGMVNLTRDFGITSRPQADHWLKHHHGLLMARRSGRAPRLTLGQAVERYEEHLRASRERPYAEATISSRTLAARRVRDQLGAGRLVDTLREGRDLEISLAAVTGGSTSAETRQSARARTRAFYATLLDYGLVPLLSYEAIRRAFRAQRGGLAPKVRPLWLRLSQISTLARAAKGHPLEGFVRLLLLTGPRLHSALELRWEATGPEQGWVDLDGRTIHYWSRKTRSHHVWRLRWSPTVEDWLHGQARQGELVFEGLTKHKAYFALRFNRRVDGKVIAHDGVLRQAVPALRWKDLRSTAATYLHCASGIPGGTMEKALAMRSQPVHGGQQVREPGLRRRPGRKHHGTSPGP